MRFMIRLAVIVCFLASSAAMAQIPTRGNIFLGFSYAQGEVSGSPTAMYGWNGSLEGKMMKYLGVVADFGAHYGSETQLTGAQIGRASCRERVCHYV